MSQEQGSFPRKASINTFGRVLGLLLRFTHDLFCYDIHCRAKKEAAAAAASGGSESNESRVELIKRPREYQVVFTFPEVTHISPPVLECRDVHFRYKENLPWLFHDMNFGLVSIILACSGDQCDSSDSWKMIISLSG